MSLNDLIDDALRFAELRLRTTLREVKARFPADYRARYPIFTVPSGPDIGRWVFGPNTHWRSGFFPGMMWKMYERTGRVAWARNARAWTSGIESLKNVPLDHDQGYRFCASFGNAHRLSDDTSDPGGAYRRAAAEVSLTAAATLNLRFDQAGIPAGALRAKDVEPPGSTYPVYTDNVMNQCLFWLAWDLSGQPATGAAKTWVARSVTQSATILAENVRPDGSTYNAVEHNDGTRGTPPDGRVRTKITLQGFAPESTWSRGQAWAIHGFTTAYARTRHDPAAAPERFLDTARRTADYFIEHLPANTTVDEYNHVVGDFVPPADFDAALGEPDGPYSSHREGTHSFTRRDSSAAAIAASGLIELSTLVDEESQQRAYLGAAEDILRCLLTFRGSDGKLAYLARDSVHQGVLAGASVDWDLNHDENSLIHGDYYFVEAMIRYQDRTGRAARMK